MINPQVETNVPITVAKREIDQPLVPGDITRLSVIGNTDLNPDSKGNPQVLDIIRVQDGRGQITLPLTFNLKDQLLNQKTTGLSPESVVGLIQQLTLSSSGEVASNVLLERMAICLVELRLPPLLSAYFAGQEDLSIDYLRSRFNPLDQKTNTKLVGLTGASRSLKTTFLAIEQFRGHLVAEGIEPFSIWTLQNMIQVLKNSGLNPKKATDAQLVQAIHDGFANLSPESNLDSTGDTLSTHLDKLASHFETGKKRPDTLFLDLTGISTQRERPLQTPDLISFFGVDALLYLERHTPGTNRHDSPIDIRVLRDYRRQLKRLGLHVKAIAVNARDEWVRKLDWDMTVHKPHKQLSF
jgi:hypothetical protein